MKKVLTVKLENEKSKTAYFEKSGIRFGERLKHNPFIVFRESDDKVTVEVVDNAKDLIKLPNKTRVIAQWRGNNQSDFVQFTVEDLRTHCKKNPKHTCQVV